MRTARAKFTVENEAGQKCSIDGVVGLVVYNVPVDYFQETVMPNLADGLKLSLGFSDWMGPQYAVNSVWAAYGKNTLATGKEIDFSTF